MLNIYMDDWLDGFVSLLVFLNRGAAAILIGHVFVRRDCPAWCRKLRIPDRCPLKGGSWPQPLGQPKVTLTPLQKPSVVVVPPMLETNCIQCSGCQHPGVSACWLMLEASEIQLMLQRRGPLLGAGGEGFRSRMVQKFELGPNPERQSRAKQGTVTLATISCYAY